jgi:hypothetical protein
MQNTALHFVILLRLMDIYGQVQTYTDKYRLTNKKTRIEI